MRLPAPTLPILLSALAALAALAPLAARAADAPAPATNGPSTAKGDEPVIVPDVDRRDVRVPKFPSNDIELGLFGGTYTTDNFGTSGVGGARLGYHITEDFFVEGSFGFSRVSDKAFRQVLPGGIFATGVDTLRYRELSLGWNLLPGEVFLGSRTAKPSAIYVIAGLGTTSFDQQRAQTVNYGMGARVFVKDWFAVRFDVRDHVFVLDLLGRRQVTNNPELTTGLSFLF
jgi:outer membrane beta-barrel protein